MKSFSKWFSALAALVLLAGPAVAGDAIAAGRVKGIHADKKEFVLTDTLSGNFMRPLRYIEDCRRS